MGAKRNSCFIVFLLLTAVLHSHARIKIVVHSPQPTLSWVNARQQCQSRYVDMVTWNTVNINKLASWLVQQQLEEVWFGLHWDDSDPAWKWINTMSGEGLIGADVTNIIDWYSLLNVVGSCGSFLPSSRTFDGRICETKLPFICYDDNLVLVTESKTWEEALDHCRAMSTPSLSYDLLSMTNMSDCSYVKSRIYEAITDEVWTGLRFLGEEWYWSDGSAVNNQDILPLCPASWRFCGTLFKDETGDWTTRDCSEKRNFVCASTKILSDDTTSDD